MKIKINGLEIEAEDKDIMKLVLGNKPEKPKEKYWNSQEGKYESIRPIEITENRQITKQPDNINQILTKDGRIRWTKQKNCIVCGTKIRRGKRWTSFVTCSKECKLKHVFQLRNEKINDVTINTKQQTTKPSKNKNKSSGTATGKCFQCGKTLNPRIGKNHVARKFCDVGCANKYFHPPKNKTKIYDVNEHRRQWIKGKALYLTKTGIAYEKALSMASLQWEANKIKLQKERQAQHSTTENPLITILRSLTKKEIDKITSRDLESIGVVNNTDSWESVTVFIMKNETALKQTIGVTGHFNYSTYSITYEE